MGTQIMEGGTEMELRVVGAGVGRTGTKSLQLALAQLLDGRCYHMLEVFEHPEHIPVWERAVAGEPVDWDALLGDYAATVDWPACAFWKELSDLHPGAVILLSKRSSPEAWWASMEPTIIERLGREPPPPDTVPGQQARMARELISRRFCDALSDQGAMMAAYERHNDEVRRTAASDRLVEWEPGDGWAPICERLGLAVPDGPFPHENTTAAFRTRLHLDEV